MAGWGQNGDATRQLITLVNLRHDAEHPQVSRRFDLVTEALREVMADVVEVRAAGEGDLAQLLDLALVGDVVSLCCWPATRGSTRARSRWSTTSSTPWPPAASPEPWAGAGPSARPIGLPPARRRPALPSDDDPVARP